ncbi:hypothetical protein [Levilactobacillus angrenensis]|uniref:Uncharacterized protein n=1 Tax=Levilactobacillus angrenensis TaxID=2486020 RepID=A0ABW1U8C4_9LACO|nr:hypothetical protein [Levilactobacillus angrenensis]
MKATSGIKALFRASLMLNAVAFQYVLDDKPTFVQEDADAS